MSSIRMKVEAHVGYHIDTVIKDMYNLSSLLNVSLECPFNDAELHVYPNGNYVVWDFTKNKEGQYNSGHPIAREGTTDGHTVSKEPRRPKVSPLG